MEVETAITRRRSCRAYRTDTVPRDLIDRVLKAARLAPSACNRQPWRFAVVTDATLRQKIVSDGFGPGLAMPWAAAASVLIVLGMQRTLVVHRLAALFSRVDYPWIDIGIAGEHLVLQAEALGLGTCWIGWIQPTRLRALVGWPRTIRPASVLTLGWPADADAPSPRTPRKDMAELVTWM